jgi:hypothetical protein
LTLCMRSVSLQEVSLLSQAIAMKIGFLLILASFLSACTPSNMTRVTKDIRESFTGSDLDSTAFYVAVPMEFVSLKKGEIVGEDIFKYEKKKTFKIEESTPGHVVASGPEWLAIDFGNGIVLNFRRHAADDVYRTEGWGTVTIQEERFDIKLGVLAGTYVDLVMPRVKQ